MGKKKYTSNVKKPNNQQSNLNSIVNQIDEETLVQAIVKAYQVIEENKKIDKEIDKEIERSKDSKKKVNKEKWYIQFFFMLNVLCFPWKISKRFTINNQIYDGILVLFVSLVLELAGAIIWIIGICTVGYDIVLSYQGTTVDVFCGMLAVGTLLMLFGSVFFLAGKEFSKVSDSNRIYAYSASVIALISCVVTIASLIN